MGVKVVNCWNKKSKISLLDRRRDPFSFKRRKEESYSYGYGEWGMRR